MQKSWTPGEEGKVSPSAVAVKSGYGSFLFSWRTLVKTAVQLTHNRCSIFKRKRNNKIYQISALRLAMEVTPAGDGGRTVVSHEESSSSSSSQEQVRSSFTVGVLIFYSHWQWLTGLVQLLWNWESVHNTWGFEREGKIFPLWLTGHAGPLLLRSSWNGSLISLT